MLPSTLPCGKSPAMALRRLLLPGEGRWVGGWVGGWVGMGRGGRERNGLNEVL